MVLQFNIISSLTSLETNYNTQYINYNLDNVFPDEPSSWDQHQLGCVSPDSDAIRCTESYHPAWWPNIAWPSAENIRIFSWSEAWNLPISGCKSMVEGLIIMLRVFINLLYTHTMPNNHYCSTYMMAYPRLMAKHCLTIGRKSGFFPDLRHETCQ